MWLRPAGQQGTARGLVAHEIVPACDQVFHPGIMTPAQGSRARLVVGRRAAVRYPGAPVSPVNSYRRLLALAGPGYVVVAFLGRLPLAMSQLGSLLLVSSATRTLCGGGHRGAPSRSQ
jgi:hypothetical protein